MTDIMLALYIVFYCCREGSDDPLDDTAMVTQQLEQLSVIGRCEYQKTCSLIVQLFDQAAQNYQELLQRQTSASADLAIQEGRLEGNFGVISNEIFRSIT